MCSLWGDGRGGRYRLGKDSGAVPGGGVKAVGMGMEKAPDKLVIQCF